MVHQYIRTIFLPVMIISACAIVGSRLYAQAGSESDPVVSLSYLNAATRMSPMIIEGGEEFNVPSGTLVMLLDGKCRLLPPSKGRFWILDVGKEVINRNSVDLLPGSCCYVISEDSNAVFTVRAWEISTVAVPGGSVK